MTVRMALKIIRSEAPETENTFQIIRRNRDCRPSETGRLTTSQKLKI